MINNIRFYSSVYNPTLRNNILLFTSILRYRSQPLRKHLCESARRLCDKKIFFNSVRLRLALCLVERIAKYKVPAISEFVY